MLSYRQWLHNKFPPIEPLSERGASPVALKIYGADKLRVRLSEDEPGHDFVLKYIHATNEEIHRQLKWGQPDEVRRGASSMIVVMSTGGLLTFWSPRMVPFLVMDEPRLRPFAHFEYDPRSIKAIAWLVKHEPSLAELFRTKQVAAPSRGVDQVIARMRNTRFRSQDGPG